MSHATNISSQHMGSVTLRQTCGHTYTRVLLFEDLRAIVLISLNSCPIYLSVEKLENENGILINVIN